MAHPYLALRPTRNGWVSHYAVAGSKNPLPLGMGSVKMTTMAFFLALEELENCVPHSRYFSDELGALIF